jgi:hypothetical protein
MMSCNEKKGSCHEGRGRPVPYRCTYCSSCIRIFGSSAPASSTPRVLLQQQVARIINEQGGGKAQGLGSGRTPTAGLIHRPLQSLDFSAMDLSDSTLHRSHTAQRQCASGQQ